MNIGRNAAFDNPLFWLTCAGLQGPYTTWAIAHGALQDWCPRAVNEADFGNRESREVALRAFPKLRIDGRPVLR